MSKKLEIPKHILEALKKEVERVFGFPVNSNIRHEKLCDDLYAKCSERISSRTVYRVFSSSSNPVVPSKHTLDLLSRYCGYDCVEEFSKLYVDDVSFSVFSELDILKDIYNISYKSESIKYRDPALFSITKTLVQKLRKKGSYRDGLVLEYSKHPIAQSYYIEQFVDYDSLDKFYNKAIQVYLKNKEGEEAQIFGNCLLYLHAFLTQDAVGCKVYFDKINEFKLDMHIHPFVVGRYFACNLMHSHFYLDDGVENVIEELVTIEKYVPRKGDSYENFPCFHFMVCDALIKCEEYQVCLDMLDKAFAEYPKGRENVDQGFYNAFYLFYAICFHKLGDSKKRDKNLKECKEGEYNFLSQNYYSIQQKLLELEITESKIEERRLTKEIDDLVEETGFSYFK